jgi:hypothetical protein
VRAAHPRIGGLILAFTDDPATTTAWARGAEGERMVGGRLDSLESAGVVSLHDRRIPGSKANIDHIAVGPSGVFVIDTKRYRGEVAMRPTGTFWRPGPGKLYVGRRDRSKLIDNMASQVAAVERALAGLDLAPSVTPMLYFAGAEWGWFARPFVLSGVWVGWATAMAEVVAAPGALYMDQINVIAGSIARSLPPA